MLRFLLLLHTAAAIKKTPELLHNTDGPAI